MKHILTCLCALCSLFLLGGCNNEDDVIEIFTGKTWKLSYIAAEGSNRQFDFWGNDPKARENSMMLLGGKDNFTVTFDGSDIGGNVVGTFGGRCVSATVKGQWNADGKEKSLSLTTTVSGSESDVLARAFLTGMQNAFRYSGDANNLFIYYREGQTVKYMGFTPQR